MAPDEKFALIRQCARATGLTLNEVVRIAGIGPMRYKVYQIPKRSGGQRTICHPSRELKALQYVFLREILTSLPVHEAATGYQAGSSIKANAAAHKESRVILKLDFESFFPSIKASDWEAYVRSMLPTWSDEDISFSQYVMFWGAGTYTPMCLSIGAPTSPFISNAIMYQFDGVISNYAADNGLVYTRYADDITVSSDGFMDVDAVVAEIKAVLATIPYPKLKLNAAKTKIASKSTSRRITGLVISNDCKVSLGRDRKRLIRAMVHHALTGQASPEGMAHLAGLLSFASDVEPSFIATLIKKFGADAIHNLRVPKAGGV
jgi:retron-type reverse transcriptase